jgi:CRISPR-associated protein Cmr4
MERDMKTKMYWLHALTSVHPGTGVGVGFIDLPIAREKVTGWPTVPGSGIKGVLADSHGAAKEEDRKHKDNAELRAAFGVADSDGESTGNSGSLVFCDARLVCLPVRSIYGTFAWVASALCLARLARDLEAAGVTGKLPVPSPPAVGKVQLPKGGTSVLCDTGKDFGKVFFTDLDFEAEAGDAAKQWADKIAGWVFPDDAVWPAEFTKRFAVVSDDTFNNLCQNATEVTPRIRINPDKKTVDSGALWYEEYLPAESLLAGLVWCDKVYHNPAGKITPEGLLAKFCQGVKTLQVGGKGTVGKGWVRCVFGE